MITNADLALALVGALFALGALSTFVGVATNEDRLIDGGALSIVLAMWLAHRVVSGLDVVAPQHDRPTPVDLSVRQ